MFLRFAVFEISGAVSLSQISYSGGDFLRTIFFVLFLQGDFRLFLVVDVLQVFLVLRNLFGVPFQFDLVSISDDQRLFLLREPGCSAMALPLPVDEPLLSRRDLFDLELVFSGGPVGDFA